MSSSNITAQVLGGQARAGLAGRTVGDIAAALGLSGPHTATVNGVPKKYEDCISDFSFVTFSPSVKGA